MTWGLPESNIRAKEHLEQPGKCCRFEPINFLGEASTIQARAPAAGAAAPGGAAVLPGHAGGVRGAWLALGWAALCGRAKASHCPVVTPGLGTF